VSPLLGIRAHLGPTNARSDGIAGGFTGAGAKTVIPAKAVAKSACAWFPSKIPTKIVAAYKKFVATHTAGIQTEVA